MLDDTTTLSVSARELALIDAALQTQEKILSVQSRAGGSAARAQLADLHGVQRRIRARTQRVPFWTRMLRAMPCLRGCAQA